MLVRSGNKYKLLLILNPVAGKGRGKARLFEAVDTFTKFGYRVTVLPTSPNGDTERIIAEEAKDYQLAVAIGGDGTLNAVSSGIMKSGTELPMGYIPLGSTNDFAYSLGLTKNIKESCQKIAEGQPKKIDIGRFGDRYFVYIACTGLFAGASYMTSQQLKNAIGHSAYILKGISDLAEIKKVRYKAELENETIGGDFLLASVSNSLRAGGIFTLPKSAVEFDDGLFELTLIKSPKNIIEFSSLTNDLINGKLDTQYIIRRRVRRLKIKTDTPQGWSLDGENGGEASEALIEIKEKALNLIY